MRTHAIDISQEQNTGFRAEVSEEHSHHFIEHVLQVLH